MIPLQNRQKIKLGWNAAKCFDAEHLAYDHTVRVAAVAADWLVIRDEFGRPYATTFQGYGQPVKDEIAEFMEEVEVV